MKQMRVISIIWGGFLVLALVLLTFLGFKLRDKELKYKDLEKKIENYAESYVEAYSKYPLGEDKLKITLENLLTNDIMKKDILDKENCTDAYVMVYLKDMVYHFDGYLKCEEYTTKNYK